MAVTPGVRRPPVSSDLKIASKEQFLGPMREAWRDVEDHGHFTQVESRRNLTEHQLREHGLYGRQLAFKLAVIRILLRRYLLIGKGTAAVGPSPKSRIS